jgi:hypothetical protein
VRRLHERPQRRSRALALALSDAACTSAAAASSASITPASQTAPSAAALCGESQTLMVPLYAPGAGD